MERRLLRVIMTPAMIASWVFGLALIVALPEYYLQQGWLHAKLTLVVLLTACHGLFARWVRGLAKEGGQRSLGVYRTVAEVPTVLMIAIVILAVVQPF
jgi:putative membrane protein